MALEWSKQISFSGLKKPMAKPKDVYPEKTYINLVVQDKKTMDRRRSVPIAIIVVVLVALFLKFGVFDFYSSINAKQAELAIHQNVLNTLTADLAGYDKVREQYEGYQSFTIAGEGLLVDALDVLALVDQYIAPYAHVASLALNGDTLQLSLTNITLDGVGVLTRTLYEQDIVANVTVSTAATQQTEGDEVTATMTITLQQASAKAN